jgi:AcrR family transcriptional regulator
MASTWHQDVRNRNRNDLIVAGQTVFIEQNFTNVELKEVCKRANLSKVTFYKCFSSMDDLIFAIQHKVIYEMTDFIDQHTSSLKKTGLMSLEGYLDAWIDFLKTNPSHLKFIGFFDQTYRDHYPNEELQATYRELVNEGTIGKILQKSIEQGIQDGTLRSGLNMERINVFIIEIMMSLMQRLAFRGKLLEEEHGFNFEDIAETSKEFIMYYLKK